jgi:uncharacterized protein (TIGR02996 family)
MTVPTSTYHEHLAAINQAPEDDEPRLAFARFIEPHEPDLAAFVQSQVARVAIERRAGVPATTDLPAAERRLLARGRAKWSRGVSRFAHHAEEGCAFHRGFVAGIAIDPEVFLEYAARLMIEAPIRHVDFSPLGGGVLSRLLASKAITQLDSIGFTNIDDDSVVAIAESDALRRCLYLDLGDTEFGPRAFSALAASRYARQLLVVQCWPDRELRWHLNALELVHGDLPWLRRHASVSRYDARWYVDHERKQPGFNDEHDDLTTEDRVR